MPLLLTPPLLVLLLPCLASVTGQCPAAIALIVFTFIFFWFVGGLSGFHTYLVATNQTTYENFRYNHSHVSVHACLRIRLAFISTGIRRRSAASPCCQRSILLEAAVRWLHKFWPETSMQCRMLSPGEGTRSGGIDSQCWF
jgi:hypothetical protein